MANEFLSCCNHRPDLAPDNSLPLTGVSLRLAYIGDWHCGVAMMDGAVVLQPAPSEQYYFPYFFDAYRRGDLQAELRINMASS